MKKNRRFKRKLYLWHLNNTVLKIFSVSDRKRFFIRNHNASNFNDKFIIVLDVKYQGSGVRCYRLGFFNWALCYLVKRKK